MNERLKGLIEEYIRDTLAYHKENHLGEISDCGYTGCRFAVDLMGGSVDESIYWDIVNGKEKRDAEDSSNGIA